MTGKTWVVCGVAAFLCAGVMACTEKGPKVTIIPKVQGAVAKIKVLAPVGTRVTFEGETVTIAPSQIEGGTHNSHTFIQPSSALGEGSHEIEVEVEDLSGETFKHSATLTITESPEVFVQITGCKSKGEPGDADLIMEHEGDTTDFCDVSGGLMDLELFAPTGSTVESGGRSVEVGEDLKTSLPIDMVSAMSNRAIEALLGKPQPAWEMPVEIKVKAASGATATQSVSLKWTGTPNIVPMLRASLKKTPSKGVNGVVATPDNKSGLLVTDKSVAIVGDGAEPLSQLDVVALPTITEGPSKSCGPYAFESGEGRLKVKVIPRDWEVVAYNALDGSEVARRTFEGKRGCPRTYLVNDTNDDTLNQDPKIAEITAWLEKSMAR